MFIFFWNLEFWNQNSDFLIFQQQNSKKNPTKIFGIKNRIGIPLPMEVPEIGTKNQNYQPSYASGKGRTESLKASLVHIIFLLKMKSIFC
jgi:hypothetical protein